MLMTRISRAFSITLVALPLVAGRAAGQVTLPNDNTAYGTTSGEFLLLGASARGTALGGAYAALSTDVSALYYNPAGVAQLDHAGAMVSTYSYVADTRYTWAGMAFPMSGGARATYAQNFSDRFSAGFTAKIVSDKLGEATGSAFALDFGTSFHVSTANRPIRASFVIQNLGTTLKHNGVPLDVTATRPPVPGQVDVPQEAQPASLKTKDWNLPVMFRVGLALDAVASEQARVTLLSEFNQPNNNKAGFELGGEVALSDIGKSGFFVAGRGSWNFQPANNLDVGNQAGFATGLSGKESQQGLAAGFGVGYKKSAFGLGFDYAWRSLGVLGSTNFLSFVVAW